MFCSREIVLKELCAEALLKRVWFIVLFVFAAFDLIKSQGDNLNGEFTGNGFPVQYLRAGASCLAFQSRSLPVLSDTTTIVNFERWFKKYEENIAKDCCLIFFFISV